MIEAIARARLDRIARQLRAGHEAELVVEDGVMALIRARCTEVEFGRPDDRRHPDQHAAARAEPRGP